MLLVKGVFHHDPEEELLISGGGDGTIKLWSIDNLEKEGLMLLDKFKNEDMPRIAEQIAVVWNSLYLRT